MSLLMSHTALLHSSQRWTFFLKFLFLICAVNSCPDRCKCSQNETVLHCMKMPLNITSFFEQIRELYLSNNFLGPKLNKTFINMPTLEVLDLSQNGIFEVDENVLNGLANLKVLNLKQNYLTKIPNKFFKDLTHLQLLDLSQNKFKVIPDICIKFLKNLRVFNISYNQITVPNLGLRFQELEKLEVLDLSWNNFQYLSNNTFLIAKSWNQEISRYVNLSNCNVKGFDVDVFSYIPGLKCLSLSGNKIRHPNLTNALGLLQESNLKILDLSNNGYSDIMLILSNLSHLSLIELNLSENKISSLPKNAFQYLSSLKMFHVSKNRMTSVVEIQKLVNLEYLDVSNNMISKLETAFTQQVNKLVVLVANHNDLTKLSTDTLSHIKDIKELDVSYNNLKELQLPKNLESLKILNVKGNKIKKITIPAGVKSLKSVDVSYNQIAVLSAFQFSGMKKLQLANFSNNQISTVDSRAFKGRTPEVIDLSKNKLKTLGYYGWEKAVYVYLSHNKIQSVNTQAFYAMSNLKVLDLQHNEIKKILPDTFKHMVNVSKLLIGENQYSNNTDFREIFRPLHSLQILDISSSNLVHINRTFIQECKQLQKLSLSRNKLKNISPTIFNGLTNLQEVDLSNNPFACECDLLPFQKWLCTTEIKVTNKFQSGYTCQSPNKRYGEQVTEFHVSDFECLNHILYIVILCSVCGIVLIIGIVFGIAYCSRHHWKQKHLDQGKDKKDRKPVNRWRTDRIRVASESLQSESSQENESFVNRQPREYSHSQTLTDDIYQNYQENYKWPQYQPHQKILISNGFAGRKGKNVMINPNPSSISDLYDDKYMHHDHNIRFYGYPYSKQESRNRTGSLCLQGNRQYEKCYPYIPKTSSLPSHRSRQNRRHTVVPEYILQKQSIPMLSHNPASVRFNSEGRLKVWQPNERMNVPRRSSKTEWL